MALIHDYTLICEQVRMEIGGKFIIIGLFPNGIGAPQLPFALPTLTFFNALRADSLGAYKFSGKLQSLEGGPPLAQAQGVIPVQVIAPVIMPIAFQNLRFLATGTYTWSLEIEGQEGPFATQFQVAINPPGQVIFGSRMGA